MLQKELNELRIKFYEDVEKLGFISPVSDISKKTGYAKGNISSYLNKKLEPSEQFLKKFYDSFRKELEEIEVETPENTLPNHPTDMQHIPNNIKLIRELYNETQEEFLQHFTGVTLSMQKSYESGRAKPGTLYLNQLSKLTGVAIEKLRDYPVEVEKVQKGEKVGKVDSREIQEPQSKQTTAQNNTAMEQDDWKQAYTELMAVHLMYAKSHLILSRALDKMADLMKKLDNVETNLSKAVIDHAGHQAVVAANHSVIFEALDELRNKPLGELAKKARNAQIERLQKIAASDTVEI